MTKPKTYKKGFHPVSNYPVITTKIKFKTMSITISFHPVSNYPVITTG